jgi:glycerol dehydrogenase-like iron-containing ADH family enzyme
LLRRESAGWPRYAVLSSPSAYRTAQPHLAQPPAGVAHARELDFGYLRRLSNTLPDDAELVVGLGGGLALDAAKYVALEKGLPLVLAPTIVSTGAIIHGVFARWEGRRIIGWGDEWPWINFDHILVDYEVALEAPSYLHTAGLGDILCAYAGVAEWRWRAANRGGQAVEEEVIAEFVRYHEEMVAEFEASLDAEGHLTAGSIHCIMQRLQERDSRNLPPPAASGDHPFLHALELVNDQNWIHGEIVALAALIIVWHCGDDDGLAARLDRCQVRRRPTQMGLSREALRKGLEFAPGYMEGGEVDSILRHDPVVGERFAALWAFLEGG